ncbi:LPS biosynthesis rfbu related protein [Enterococcus avium]|nr:LPS biosynthesis rfbu related protein [Enterococcus avium]
MKEMAQAISETDYHVTVLAGKDKGEDELPDLESPSPNLEIRRFKSPFGFLPFVVFKIHKYYKKELSFFKPEVIEYQTVVPLFASIYKEMKGVVILHLTGKDYIRKQGKVKGTIGYLLESKLMPFLYKKKAVLTISKHTKKQLVAIGFKEHQISVIPPVIDTMINKSNHEIVTHRSNIVSYIGRYTGRGGNKRIDDVIDVFPDILKIVPDARLIIGGSMKNENELHQLINRLGIEQSVDIKGFIDDEEKKEILSQSKVFASPSNQEGFGITYVEANSFGTPVVGYEIDGLDTVPDYAGIMVPQNNKEKLAESIVSLLTDDSRWKMYSCGALRNASRFDLETVTKELQTYIRRIIGGTK